MISAARIVTDWLTQASRLDGITVPCWGNLGDWNEMKSHARLAFLVAAAGVDVAQACYLTVLFVPFVVRGTRSHRLAIIWRYPILETRRLQGILLKPADCTIHKLCLQHALTQRSNVGSWWRWLATTIGWLSAACARPAVTPIGPSPFRLRRRSDLACPSRARHQDHIYHARRHCRRRRRRRRRRQAGLVPASIFGAALRLLLIRSINR